MFYFMHGSIFNSSVAWYAETQYLFVHLKYGFYEVTQIHEGLAFFFRKVAQQKTARQSSMVVESKA